METILILLSIFSAIAGIIGSIAPSLPGPILSYLGIIFLYIAKGENLISESSLVYIGITMLAILILGNIVPIATAKITGASKYGIIGSIIGTIIGIFIFPPFGAFPGVILGAIIGELYAFNDMKKAISAGFGTVIGSLVMLTAQIIFSTFVLVYLLIKIIFLI